MVLTKQASEEASRGLAAGGGASGGTARNDPMTKGILKAVPGPFPQAVRWSENNLIAVSSGPFVTVVVRSSRRIGFRFPARRLGVGVR